jgi:hypothetical protein
MPLLILVRLPSQLRGRELSSTHWRFVTIEVYIAGQAQGAFGARSKATPDFAGLCIFRRKRAVPRLCDHQLRVEI